MWQHTGQQRPPFAVVPEAGQESVWDYPRPPALTPDGRLVTVHAGARLIAQTRRAVRVLETASPPTFYLHPDDVDAQWLQRAPGSSHCEWKGDAAYWSVLGEGGAVLERAGWSYPEPRARFTAIAGFFSFYPALLICQVDGERVWPQPGGFYGGWLTREIVGPVKGEPGTGGW
jgi:uncharacterized protein (DUF427 family)